MLTKEKAERPSDGVREGGRQFLTDKTADPVGAEKAAHRAHLRAVTLPSRFTMLSSGTAPRTRAVG